MLTSMNQTGFRTNTILIAFACAFVVGTLAQATAQAAAEDDKKIDAAVQTNAEKTANPERDAILEKMKEAGTTPEAIQSLISTLYKHRLELEIDRVGIRTRARAIEVAILEQKKVGAKVHEAHIDIKMLEIEEVKNLLQRRKVELDDALKLAQHGAVTSSAVAIAKSNLLNAETMVQKKRMELNTIASTSIQYLNELLVRTSIDDAEIDARFAFVNTRLERLLKLAGAFENLDPFGNPN